uniref:Lysophosphatidic acid phosphatase type 6 (Trinotate prediction) n=1 Tax=Myxobolus squamalis TaxID=59785 RepID=A0A6B2G445_MYXSQ
MKINIRSYTTFVKRTMDSLRCVLAAMFDNDSSEVATFYSRPNEFEYYYPNIEYCLRYNNIYHDALRLENRIFRFGYNRRKLAKMLGKNVEEMPDILKLWEEVYYLKNHGFELPENYTLAYSSIKKMASDIVEFRYFEFKKLEIKLAIGFMLDDINNAINTHISGDQSPSLYLHSVHDTTIIAIMKGLDCYDGVWPEVSSYFAVELHNINTKWFVKFVYNDQPIHLKMTNDEFLPLHEFKSLIRKNQLGDVDFCKVCLTDNIQSHPNL